MMNRSKFPIPSPHPNPKLNANYQPKEKSIYKSHALIKLNKEKIAFLNKTLVEQNEKIALLEKRTSELDAMVNRKSWKITISIIAIVALLLEIFQLIGII